MNKKLTWEEIKKLYPREWVELIDYDWPECDAEPKSGVVRVHAKTRKEFDDLIMVDAPKDSALLFVNVPKDRKGKSPKVYAVPRPGYHFVDEDGDSVRSSEIGTGVSIPLTTIAELRRAKIEGREPRHLPEDTLSIEWMREIINKEAQDAKERKS